MNKYLIVFFSSFAVFIYFLTSNVNSGDAGELVTAAYHMGVSHPSGYPLYLQIGKLLTFLPFGNMAFKVTLMSALFSSMCLVLVSRLIIMLTDNESASYFSAIVLLITYSYLTQSVIAKFYPLNLFIVLLVFSLWVHICLNGLNEKALLITAFLFGLTMANHHTGILMIVPVSLMLIFYRRSIRKNMIAFSFIMFFLGIIVNLYALIRGSSQHFFTSYIVDNFEDFYRLFFRIDYGKSSSVAVSGNIFADIPNYWYSLRNFLSIITASFSIFSYPLALSGCFFLYKKNRRILLFIILALIFYGPFLAKLAFFREFSMEKDYYVSGHQYFLPALSIYALLLGMGFHQLQSWLELSGLRLLQRAIPAILLLFPLVFLVTRSADSNYRTNHVPYQSIKDMYSIVPVNSVMLSYGDNAIYQGWYIKSVGRYREDICQIGAAEHESARWFYQGCRIEMYKYIFPGVLTKKLHNALPLMQKNRFYGNDMITDDFAFKDYMYSKQFSMLHLYLPKKEVAGTASEYNPDNIDAFISKKLLTADKIVNPYPCISHMTDDLLTRWLCGSYIIHLTEMGKYFSHENYGLTGQKVFVSIIDDEKDKKKYTYTINMTLKNKPYLALATLIQEHNKWQVFYTRPK